MLASQIRQNVYDLVDSNMAKASYLGVVSFECFVPDSGSGSVMHILEEAASNQIVHIMKIVDNDC